MKSHHGGEAQTDREEPLLDVIVLGGGPAGLQAAHTLFIDDSPQHIAGAQALGIQTIWMEKGMTIEKDIFLPKG